MKHKGFTLIEILISVGIIAIVGAVISQSFFSIVRSNVKNELVQSVKQNGDVALDIMTRMIRNAHSVTSTCDTTGTTSSSITILNPNGNTSRFECFLDGTVARIASVSATKTEFLTNRNVSLGQDCVSALTFVCTMQANQKAQVQITFSLGQVGTPVNQYEQTSATFQATTAIRQ